MLDPSLPLYARRKCISLYREPNLGAEKWGDENACIWGTVKSLRLDARILGVEQNGFAQLEVTGESWKNSGFLGLGGRQSSSRPEKWWVYLDDVTQEEQLSEEEKKAQLQEEVQKKLQELDSVNPLLTASSGTGGTTNTLMIIAVVVLIFGILIYFVAKPKASKELPNGRTNKRPKKKKSWLN